MVNDMEIILLRRTSL